MKVSDLILLSAVEIWMSEHPLGLTCHLRELVFEEISRSKLILYLYNCKKDFTSSTHFYKLHSWHHYLIKCSVCCQILEAIHSHVNWAYIYRQLLWLFKFLMHTIGTEVDNWITNSKKFLRMFWWVGFKRFFWWVGHKSMLQPSIKNSRGKKKKKALMATRDHKHFRAQSM